MKLVFLVILLCIILSRTVFSMGFQQSQMGAIPNAVPANMQKQAAILSSQTQDGSSTMSSLGQYNTENRNNLLLPGEVDVRKLLPSSGEDHPPPYGANLFAGGYETERVDGLNDNYLIAAGDKINVWMWGAVNYSSVVTVDNQGNIFIPEIGPIQVKDLQASAVNAYVTSKIKKIYINNVNVYVNLLTSTPVSVFLSGPIIRPGQYAGMASDSVLYYLNRAGGIDSERGSYREIQVLRNNKVIEKIDLYNFIQTGTMPKVNFKDGDVILVTPQKAAITVSGGVRNPFRFELKNGNVDGHQLVKFSRPLAKISHVGVIGNRVEGPLSKYMPYESFLKFELADGDKIFFNDDLHAQIIDVQIAGSYLGPSYFTVENTTRLHELLQHIPVEPKLADFGNIYILRKSAALKQKQMIDESLNRLERSVLTAPVNSSGEGSIRVQEASLIMQFVAKAKLIQPLGKVIVSENSHVANILLEQGDQIVIPNITDLIQVSGEVLMPQGLVYNENAKIDDYIAWAGGFTERAEDNRIALVKANGFITFEQGAKIERGDQVLVLPKVDVKIMQSVKDITQVMYQIAIAANVAVK
jgi:protein involved in polysaccharide export with SLBB domain